VLTQERLWRLLTLFVGYDISRYKYPNFAAAFPLGPGPFLSTPAHLRLSVAFREYRFKMCHLSFFCSFTALPHLVADPIPNSRPLIIAWNAV